MTWTDRLLQKLWTLNPALEYCAIVVDEIEPAKKILERVGLSKTLLHPLYELKECVRDFFYDYIICVETDFYDEKLTNLINTYDVPKEKLVNFADFSSAGNFHTERNLRYFKAHAAEFEMFATGISYTQYGLNVTQFKRKAFNFGKSSQDLYYDFQIAKFAVNCPGNRLKFALIGLAPYSFHYDLSETFRYRYIILRYFIAFGDVHNFLAPVDVYKNFLRAEYVAAKLPLEPYDYISAPQNKRMDQTAHLKARQIIDSWSNKYYTKTCAENVRILDDYLTLCEERGIRPIMFLLPVAESYMKYFSRQKLDEFYFLVRQAQKKHPSAVFVDGWRLRGVIDADFYDCAHMNIQGATKFSAYLNKIIEQF